MGVLPLPPITYHLSPNLESPRLEQRQAPLRRRGNHAARRGAAAHERARLFTGLDRRVPGEAILDLATEPVHDLEKLELSLVVRLELADRRADAHEQPVRDLFLGVEPRGEE